MNIKSSTDINIKNAFILKNSSKIQKKKKNAT